MTTQRVAQVLSRGVRITIRSAEAGKVCGVVTVPARTRRTLRLRTAELGRGCTTLRAPGRVTLQVRLRSDVAPALRKAMRTRRSIVVQVTATARDAAGNTGRARTVSLTVRR